MRRQDQKIQEGELLWLTHSLATHPRSRLLHRGRRHQREIFMVEQHLKYSNRLQLRS